MKLILYFAAVAFLFSCNATSIHYGKEDPLSYTDSIKKIRAAQQKERITGKVIHDRADLSYFDINESYKVEAQFIASNSEESFNIPTYSGQQKEFYNYGKLVFNLKGKERTLIIYRNLNTIKMKKYKNYLFLPFMDLTTGESTYGGGRYIDLETSDIIDNKVILDFNKAYNPYCAYGDGWNCPIPPVENHLEISIKAGEMSYTGLKKDRS